MEQGMSKLAQYDINDAFKTQLSLYLRFEKWTVKEALSLLCGIDPSKASISWPPMEYKVKIRRYIPFNSDEIVEALADHLVVSSAQKIEADPSLRQLYQLESMLYDLWRIWQSGGRINDRFPPIYYLEWANKVEHEIEWLEWAKNAGKLPTKAVKKISPEVNAPSINLDEFKGKRRGSAFRLIAALLKNAYKFDVEGPKYGAMGALYKSLYFSGTEMDEDTLRSLIKEAAAVVQSDRERLSKVVVDTSTEKGLEKWNRRHNKTEMLRKSRNT